MTTEKKKETNKNSKERKQSRQIVKKHLENDVNVDKTRAVSKVKVIPPQNELKRKRQGMLQIFIIQRDHRR